MKFFESYFNKHQFKRAPHKWLLALLISPIHAAEMRYKKKYHLNFNHARKLFAFDMLLVFTAVFLAATSLFWFLYDPTITDLVHVEMTPTTHVDTDGTPTRIASGEDITYRIDYENKSDVVLVDPALHLDMPAGFIIETADPRANYNSQTAVFTLSDLPPKSSGSVEIGGIFFGEPDKEVRLTATLSYEQPDRGVREQKHASILTTLRGSLLETHIDFPETILSKGSFPVSVTLKNTSPRPMQPVTLPLLIDQGLTLNTPNEAVQSTDDAWIVPTLAPDETVEISGILTVDITENIDSKQVAVAPRLTIQGEQFPQQPATHTFTVVRPEIAVSASWTEAGETVSPGETKTLTAVLQNTSSATFENLSISIPGIGALIDAGRMRQLNSGALSGNTFTISSRHQSSLRLLGPGQRISIPINIPIRFAPQGGTDLAFLVPLAISGDVQGVLDGTYTTHAESTPLAIGTALGLTAELRYYTNEGDQLGRGPLPPRVGDETKYWVMIILSNGTSRITDLQMNARLAPGITPTGRSSVSLGNDVSHNPGTRTMSWSHPALGAHQQVGIYFEVSFTPTAGQQGRMPLIVDDISASAYDTYVDTPIQVSDGTLDISIPDDPIGRAKGTIVQ